jgi:hypothetical protein
MAQEILSNRAKRRGAPKPGDFGMPGSKPVFGMPGARFDPQRGVR